MLIVRIGKKYCPYFIRWHWTFLVVFGVIEAYIPKIVARLHYYQSSVLLVKIESFTNDEFSPIPPELLAEFNFFGILIHSFIVLHIGFLAFGLLHAICGQYFYFPYVVENVELHVGARPTYSVYSCGNTAWQNDSNMFRTIPKLWFGWFGRGSTEDSELVKRFKKWIRKFFRQLFKLFRKLMDK